MNPDLETVKDQVLPNLFLVGAPKCGTTALYHYLATHPSIFFSTPKEPGFFCTDFPTRRAVKGWNNYLGLFESATADMHVVAEASVHYLRSTVAIPEIERRFVGPRYIVMVRDPCSFLPSYHAQMLYSLTETYEEFGQAWKASLDGNYRRESGAKFLQEPRLLDYQGAACFGQQIQNLLTVVDRERIHFIDFDQLKVDPKSVYGEVLRFLDVADDGRSEFPIINANKKSRSKFLRLALSRGKSIRHFLPAAVRRKVGPVRNRVNRFNRVETKRKELGGAIRSEIIGAMKDDCELLASLTNLDLRNWLRA